MDYEYKKSGSVFNAHSYWTKQPVDVIKKFIEKNTNVGDLVLDPFCGSGMTGVAAIETNRRYILSDISPICIHIAKGYCNKIDSKKALSYLPLLVDKIKYLFETTCPCCGKKVSFDYCILEDKLECDRILDFKSIVLHCKCSKEKIRKIPDNSDITIFNDDLFKNCFYPKDDFFGNEPKRNYKKGIRQVYQLYSSRNLSALAMLKKNILNIDDENIRQFYLFAFTSILFNCSIMSRYNPKYENTQIKMGSFYIPQFIKDNNVVLSFERKINSIIKANSEIFSENTINDGVINIGDATNMSNIENNSIDYIYTDPPYSDKISYSELNLVYESWLGNGITNSEKEMIVSKAAGKSIEFYSNLFSKFLDESKRVLKESKKITIVFHNSSLEHWAYFQNTIIRDGLRPVISKLPERILSSSKTSTQYQTTNDSQCFLVFEFIKDSSFLSNNYIQELDEISYGILVDKLRDEAIKLGYSNSADQFDYIISSLMYKAKINPKYQI